MRLVKVEIEGYRSISDRLSLHLDPSVTVVLGANDHGKTNFLEALRHLNEDEPFIEDRDLNWDYLAEDRSEQFPEVVFEFELDEDDKDALWGAVLNDRGPEDGEEQTEAEVTAADDLETEESATEGDATEPGTVAESGEPSSPESSSDSRDPELTRDGIPSTVTFSRKGVAGDVEHSLPPAIGSQVAAEFIQECVPRVEIIAPHDKVPDSVSADELASEEHEFMR